MVLSGSYPKLEIKYRLYTAKENVIIRIRLSVATATSKFNAILRSSRHCPGLKRFVDVGIANTSEPNYYIDAT